MRDKSTNVITMHRELEHRVNGPNKSEPWEQVVVDAGSFCWRVTTEDITWSDHLYRIFQFEIGVPLTLELIRARVHPEDLAVHDKMVEEARSSGNDFDYQYRLMMPDGSIKYLRSVAHATRDQDGQLEYIAAVQDVTEQVVATVKLEKAFEHIKQLKDRLQDENVVLREQVDQAFMFEEIVGVSAALKAVLSRVSKVAATDSTVLLTGETGTGKELIARAVHKRSRRSSHAFVTVNCVAIPPSLIASELFGHEKGAFTGATQRRRGRFELAHGGTIFLDEVGELPMETQVALLHVLQERQFERVGGSASIRVDVRVVAATNRNLQAAIEAGTFRSDLFYRLNSNRRSAPLGSTSTTFAGSNQPSAVRPFANWRNPGQSRINHPL
jgi:formate hydrogenlyase transcriptional activator